MKTSSWRVILGTISCLLLTHIESGLGDYFEECDGVESETFVASSQDCNAYIYCDGDDSLMGTCNEGEYFDGDELVCDLEENVYCPLNAASEELEEPQDTTTTSPTTTTTKTTTTTTTATAATMVPITNATDALTIPALIMNQCPKMDDPNQIVLMPNSQSCSEYYLCYHDHAIAMQCTDQLHFNTHTGKCDFPENVQCLSDRPNANKCLPHITDFFPHPEKCNYFYYCIKGFMTIQQCPFYYGWDIERRSCVQITQAKCYNNSQKFSRHTYAV